MSAQTVMTLICKPGLDSGGGDQAADDGESLPGMLSEVQGERGPCFQRGHQKGSGVQSKDEELQKEEAMCRLMKPTGAQDVCRGTWYSRQVSQTAPGTTLIVLDRCGNNCACELE